MSADEKIKTAAGKPPLGTVPQQSLIGPSRVFQYGSKKYAAGNYYLASLSDGAGGRYVSAALRHLADMQLPNGIHTGESLAACDVESGLPHIDHVLCGLLMLRTIMVKDGVLPVDPGVGNEPTTVSQRAAKETYVGIMGDVAVVRRLAPLDERWGACETACEHVTCGVELSTEAAVREVRVASGAYDVQPASDFTAMDKPGRTGPGDP